MAKRARGKGGRWPAVPTRATIIPDQPDPDPLDEDEDDEPKPGSDDEDVEELLSQVPQETRVELAKWNPIVEDWSYAGRYPAHGFTLDMVARLRGAGKYRMIVRGPKEGKVAMKGKRIFYIDPSIAPPAPEPGGGARGGIIEQGIVQVLNLQMEMTRTMLTAMGEREKMSDVVSAVANMMKPAGGGSDDLMKILLTAVLKDRDQPEHGPGWKDMLEVLEKGMELGERTEGGGIGAAGMALAKLVEHGISGEGKGDVRQLPPGKTPAPAPVPSAATAARDAAAAEMERFFKVAGAVLAPASRKGPDNLDLYVDWTVDQIEMYPALDPYLEQWFNDGSYPDMLLPLLPEVDAAWLRALLWKVRETLTADDEPTLTVDRGDPAAAGRGRRDEPDAPRNGAADQRGPDSP